ncbi:MAG: response regulator [Myxococcota bacterium]
MLQIEGRAFVIEDDDDLRTALSRVVAGWGADVSATGTAAEAKELLSRPPPPELLLVDVRLADDSAFGVLDVASRLSPAPVIVAISGKASPGEAFRLAQHGVCEYLAKPFSIEELVSAVERARQKPPNLGPLIAAQVGWVPMRELQREVRQVMVQEALARTEGSRSGAARLLHVTRQAVQHIIRRSGAPPDAPPETKVGSP